MRPASFHIMEDKMNKLCNDIIAATEFPLPVKKDYKIGCLGSGFIMADCQLEAYRQNGFCVKGIASRTYENARKTAERYGIPQVYESMDALIDDPELEIIDIGLPPHIQVELVKKICARGTVKGILCQKPVALNTAQAKDLLELAEKAGIVIAVNQNMRYDQSVRALKYAMEQGYIGTPVVASIDMRAQSEIQKFYEAYGRFEILDMAIHHLDVFRYLFGTPQKLAAFCRQDPKEKCKHRDGISQIVYQYEDGLLATILDDKFTGPDKPAARDRYIEWRVEGTKGIAIGRIGWPDFPEISPSTFRMASTELPGTWIAPSWEKAWFPHAFSGPMAELMIALENGREPVNSLRDNLDTMRCVDACYLSLDEERTIHLEEMQ